MKLDKKAWYAIGLVILGIILCFTTAKTIGTNRSKSRRARRRNRKRKY